MAEGENRVQIDSDVDFEREARALLNRNELYMAAEMRSQLLDELLEYLRPT